MSLCWVHLTHFWKSHVVATIMMLDKIRATSWEKSFVVDKQLRSRSACTSALSSQPLINSLSVTCDFQQCGILTSVDSDEPLHPPFKLRNYKWRSVSSLTIIEYLSDWQRLWSACAYVQAGLNLCWSHIPHCWKSHVVAQLWCLAKKKATSWEKVLLLTNN